MTKLVKIPLALLAALCLAGVWALSLAADPANKGVFEAYERESSALRAIRSGDAETGRRLLSPLAGEPDSPSAPDENAADTLYDLGNIAYGSGEFSRARDYYLRSSPRRVEGEFRRLHNLGNTEYRLGEAESDDTARILLWSSAIERYEAALAWREDGETRENLEFVRKKLEDMRQSERQPQLSGESGSGAQSSSGESAGSGSSSRASSGERIPQSGGVWRNTGDFDRVGNPRGDSGQGLSESERAGLERRMRSIDELNKTGQQYLRRDGTPRQGQDGEFFGTVPYFESSLETPEKDW